MFPWIFLTTLCCWFGAVNLPALCSGREDSQTKRFPVYAFRLTGSGAQCLIYLYLIQHSRWFSHSRYSLLICLGNEGSNHPILKTVFLVLTILWLTFQVIYLVYWLEICLFQKLPQRCLWMFSRVFWKKYFHFLYPMGLVAIDPYEMAHWPLILPQVSRGGSCTFSLGSFSRSNFPQHTWV